MLGGLLAGNAAQAQTTQGTRVLGLSGGDFTFQSNDFSKRFSGTVIPSVGVFVADNLAVGAALQLGYSSFQLKSLSNFRNNSLAIGLLPWLRYYLPSESRHRLFGELSAGGVYNRSRAREDSFPNERISSDINFLAKAGLGYSYFITPAVGLEGLLSYQRTGGDRNTFGGGALGLNLGFRIYLPTN
ncbi:acyloxyacyl hydrolase [Hymenobacter sp. ISL-91]|uniref:acyloxyacyl hydrolase n=1 Tax=Hymenobacter sp. ISL-91 TaxID=2819151 RepID=UPI001BEB0DBD|nr:acyloxyacyl hydrolase [Hymenobacter sp. ISL-91]MBT2556435.1 acyloxyacyl hydrolase [Hymenobacter sp. ISL-91]